MKFFSGLIIGIIIGGGIFFVITKAKELKNYKDSIKQASSATPSSNNINEQSTDGDVNNTVTDAKDVVTFLLSGNNEIYYYKGVFTGALQKTDYTGVKELIKKFHNEPDSGKLLFVIKSNKGATFKNVIDLLDEMAKNNLMPTQYKEMEISNTENEKLNLLIEKKNG